MLNASPLAQKEEAHATPPAAAKPLRIRSEDLLGPRQEVIILHGGREYRLRRTQTGKLILTA
jgi:hemin uptake protein HemP